MMGKDLFGVDRYTSFREANLTGGDGRQGVSVFH